LAQSAAESSLSPSSRDWLAASDPLRRKQHGQYLTPRPVAEALLDRVTLRPGMPVLDPGCGTGELLAAVTRREPGAGLTGWDIDESALLAARELVPHARLELRSALDPPSEEDPNGGEGMADGPFDLVIANPPYFQVRVTPELKAHFGEVISGRANIFALFFKTGLDLLRPGGTLAYIVPPSMNSGAYFEALREHIVSRARIIDLTVLEGSGLFEGANTAAQLLILEKHGPGQAVPPDPGSPTGRSFVFERSEPSVGFRRVIFSQHPERLREGFEGRRTLWQLGYEAVTGTVVWNQRRADLRTVPGPGTVPLVFSRDLRGGALDHDGIEGASGPRETQTGRARSRVDVAGTEKASLAKAGHIASERRLTGPALLINRVIGAVGRGELRTALVSEGVEFLAENHVNVIRLRTDPDAPGRPGLDWQQLQAAIEQAGTAGRARLLTGNTQLSATELTHLVPV